MNKKELEKYIATRPSAKESDGAWNRFVESNKLAEKETPKETWNRLDNNEKIRQQKYVEKLEKFGRENSQHPQDKYYDNKMNEIDKKGTSYLSKQLKKLDGVPTKRVINKSLNKFENRTANKDVVTFDPTTQLFTDESRNIAFQNYHKAKMWNDAVNGQPTATPKQVNDLDQRLKRNGFTGSSTKPFIKKKKITTPIEPVKIDISSYTSFLPTPIRKDPELIRQEQNIMRIKDEMDREKIKRATTGLAGLMGGDPFYGK